MLWLTAYCDACGHPSAKHALAVGGYLSSVPAWLRFERKWRRTLKKAGITIPFHMSDFMACEDGFEDWEGCEDEQARLLQRLAKITQEHVRYGLSTMILLDAWRRVNETYALDKNHCTPYAVCGFFTMNKAFSWLLNRTRRFNVRFVFEDGDKHKGDFIWIMDQFVRMDKRLLKGVRPSFESKELAPLQAADFVMWEQLNLAKDRLRNPKTPAPLRESFQELYSIKKQWGVIDEEKLVRFCEDFGVPKQGEDRVWDGPFRPAEPPQLTKLAGDQP